MSDDTAYRDFLNEKFDVGQLFDKPEPLAGVRVLEVVESMPWQAG